MKRISKIMVAVLSMVLLLGVIPSTAVPSEAASKNAMENVNVLWNIKPNKLVCFYTSVYGTDRLQSGNVIITNYKNSSKGGKTTIKFRANWHFDEDWNITPGEAARMIKDDNYSMGYYYAIVDYKTGKSLEADNKYGVKVTEKWQDLDKETSGYNYYESTPVNGMNSVYFPRTIYCDVTVTYPSSYENLCIGIGGSTSATETAEDTAFWKGEKSFKDTSYYGKAAGTGKIAHFMRVDGDGNYRKK